MKYMKKAWGGFFAVGAIIVLALGHWAYGYLCRNSPDNKFHLIQACQGLNPAVTTDDVVTMLGQPSRIEESDTTGIKGTVYFYRWNDKDTKIVFLNGDLFQAEYISEKKS